MCILKSTLPSVKKPANDSPQLFDKLVTKAQLAEYVGVSRSFISKLMKTKGLPHIKIGRAVRFRMEEVVKWLERRRNA